MDTVPLLQSAVGLLFQLVRTGVGEWGRQNSNLEPTDYESARIPVNAGKDARCREGAALGAENSPFDADLACRIGIWPTLPPRTSGHQLGDGCLVFDQRGQIARNTAVDPELPHVNQALQDRCPELRE